MRKFEEGLFGAHFYDPNWNLACVGNIMPKVFPCVVEFDPATCPALAAKSLGVMFDIFM